MEKMYIGECEDMNIFGAGERAGWDKEDGSNGMGKGQHCVEQSKEQK